MLARAESEVSRVELDPRRLTVLAAIARTGGVLAAADVLHVTPSAVSQQLARLEREAGLTLVVRGGRRLELTPAGEALAEHGRRIVEELAAATETVTELTESVTGTVTLTSFVTAIPTLVAPALTAVHATHPAITVRLLPEESGLARLRAGAVDLVMVELDARSYRPPVRGLRDVALLDDPYLLVLPADWTLPRGERRSTRLRGALELPWVAGPQGSAMRSVLERLGRDAGAKPQIAHEMTEFPAVLALVRAGLGVAIVPRLALPPQQGLGGLRTLELPGVGARQVMVRHRAARGEPTRAARVVLDALVARAAEAGGGTP
jgi:DNA-binding transcriptional LysR family regulator